VGCGPDDGKDDLSGAFNPASGFGEAGIGADGANDGVSSHSAQCIGVHDDAIECGMAIVAAKSHESRGAGVAIDDALVAELKIHGDGVGKVPVKKLLFDVFAFGMAANGAFAGVAFEGRAAFGGVHSVCHSILLHFQNSIPPLGGASARAIQRGRRARDMDASRKRKRTDALAPSPGRTQIII